MDNKKPHTDENLNSWEEYARERNLWLNRTLFLHHRLTQKKIISLLKPMDRSIQVMDIGCGDGFFLNLLSQMGFQHVRGIDSSRSMVERCRKRGLSAEQKLLEELTGRERFDLILLIEVLEHLEEPQKALEFIRSILREEGKLLMTVPVCDSFLKRYERFRYRLTRERQVRSIDETHIHAFCRETILRLFRDSGLRILNCFHVSNPFPWVKRYCGLNCFNLLQRFSLGGRFGDYLIVFAGKKKENHIK